MLLAPREWASEFTGKRVRVQGVAQASDRFALQDKEDITSFPAVRRAAERAYRMACLCPCEIEFAEVHDCLTIAGIVPTEDLGFVGRGQGGPYCAEGSAALDGVRPVNPSGGLKAKGHAGGATGVAQSPDVALQIRAEAGERQLERHSVGLAQNLGGSGATAVVTILGRP